MLLEKCIMGYYSIVVWFACCWVDSVLLHGLSKIIIAELWRAKRPCGAPWVIKSAHTRKLGNHVTVHRPLPARPSAPQGNQCSISHFLPSLGAQEDWYCTHIAHQCCDQLTAVKTGSPLTSITWPYGGLRYRPIEVEYLFEVIRWKVTSFQMITCSCLNFFNSYEIRCVLCAAQLKFWFQTDLGS